MSNIKLRGEDILGMVLANFEDAEDLAAKGIMMRGIGFWAVGKAYKKIFKDIIEGKVKDTTSLRKYCDSDRNRLTQGAVSKYMSAYDVVEYLNKNGVKELPMSKEACLRLASHPQPNWVKAWKKYGVKIARLPKGVDVLDKEESTDFDKTIKSLIGTIQHITMEMEDVQRRINAGEKPSKANAVIFTEALKELHTSIVELAGIKN